MWPGAVLRAMSRPALALSRRRPPRAQLPLSLEAFAGPIAGGDYSGSGHPRVVGSKGAAGAWQRIVSLLPPHRVFIETFAGGAAVTRHKRPAQTTALYEIDAETAATLTAAMRDRADVLVINADALETVNPANMPADAVLYCDPPYVMSARKCQRPYYNHEWTDADHVRFLEWVLPASCPVVVSGYWSDIYATRLAAWRHLSFTVGTRRGRATEHVWCNFPEPASYHETDHVGDGFTDRQRIKRKAARWVRMLAAMPAAERAAVVAGLERAGLARAIVADVPAAAQSPTSTRPGAGSPASMRARVDTDGYGRGRVAHPAKAGEKTERVKNGKGEEKSEENGAAET